MSTAYAHSLRPGLLLPVLTALGVASIGLSLALGSVPIHASQLWAILTGGGGELPRSLVLELRLPRALSAFATGGLLALAGALMQVLLRNPLADPYILGVSGGAAAAALLSILLGFGAVWTSGSAFAGSLLSMLLVFGLARGGGDWAPTRLLLTGVVVAAGWGAAISLILAVSPAGDLHGMLYWLMGDLSHADQPLPGFFILVPALILSLFLARSFNLLARGGMQAAALGVRGRGPARHYLCNRLSARRDGGDHRRRRRFRRPGGAPHAAPDGRQRPTHLATQRGAAGGLSAGAGGHPGANGYSAQATAGGRDHCPDRRTCVFVPAAQGPLAAMTPQALLCAQDLRVQVADAVVCQGLHLELAAGQCWGLLGPNGSGKTTLLHTLAGLRPAETGALLLRGQAFSRLSRREIAKFIGVLFQHYPDTFPATVLETALIGRHPHLSPWALETETDLSLARRALQTMELDGFESRLAQTLSGGERRRLAVATLLVQAPMLFLLDEPANHLDIRHQIALCEHLARQARENDRALLMVLHDVNLAMRFCDHVLLLLGDGETRQGPSEELLTEQRISDLYDHPLVAAPGPHGRVFVPL